MRVQELRIGNWVNNRMGHDMQIRDAEDMQDHENFDCFIPIPLTAQWLERFGFRKIGKSNDWCLKPLILHGRKRGFVVRKSFTDITTVHALQNLFFAVSGEELTPKEQ